MEKLDVYSLSLIFDQLSLQDLANCVDVCEKWKHIIKSKKIKNLFFCYGTKFSPQKNHCQHASLTPDKNYSLVPNYAKYGEILNYLDTLNFDKIEKFIYHGNNNLRFTFPFHDKLNLSYVEIRDSEFSNCIDKEYKDYLKYKNIYIHGTFMYFSSSIETLIINEIDIAMLIYSFPNLKNIEIKKFFCRTNFKKNYNMIKQTKWKSFVIENDELFFDVQDNNLIFEFLSNKCPDLESVSFNITMVDQLRNLFNNPRLKNICIKLFWNDFSIFNLQEYKDLILKHEYRIKNHYNLCINNFPVKSFKDFIRLIETCKLKSQFNFGNLDFDTEKKFITVYGSYDNEVIRNNPLLNYVERFFIYVKPESNFKFDVLFSTVPRTMKALKIFSKQPITQNLLELIPQYFPSLEELHLESTLVEVKSCFFISKLKYLNRLTMKTLKVNIEKLTKTLKKLDYLNFLEIYSKEEIPKKVVNNLNNFLVGNNCHGSYSLILNELPLSLSDKDKEEFSAMQIFEEIVFPLF